MTLIVTPGLVLSGALIGVLTGILIGVVTMISDIIFYSRNPSDLKFGRKYSSPAVQFGVFLLINLLYGALHGVIFSLLLPFLPTGWFLRGLIFGVGIYLILSRTFAEQFAYMSADYFPRHLSVYLTAEFVVIYVLQGLLISAGMLLLAGV
ncbi:MAG: hypothetical protein ACM3JD_12025 [Rudaea sp.]